MTCEYCGGKGIHPFIDVWEMARQHKAKEKKSALPIKDVPCPECQSEAFWAYVDAMKERLGEPFDDRVADTASLWRHPDGHEVIVLKPGDTEEL